MNRNDGIDSYDAADRQRDRHHHHHHHHQDSNNNSNSYSRNNGTNFNSRNNGHNDSYNDRYQPHNNPRDYNNDDHHHRSRDHDGYGRYGRDNRYNNDQQRSSYGHGGWGESNNDDNNRSGGSGREEILLCDNNQKRSASSASSSQVGGDLDAPSKRIRSEQAMEASAEATAAAPREESTGSGKSSTDDDNDVGSFAIPDDEEAQKKAFVDCLRNFDQDTTYVSNQAHQVQEGWSKRKRSAAQTALRRLSTLSRGAPDDDAYDDDSSYDSDAPRARPANGKSRLSAGVAAAEERFVMALPHCPPLDAGFHIVSSWAGASKFCYCPCGPNVAPWREKHGIDLGSEGKCFLKDPFSTGKKKGSKTKFDPNSLMAHLRREGGMFEEKDNRRMVQRPLWDIYHYATRVYLECLYADWHGRKNGKDFGHKGLYPKQSDEYEDAACEESRLLHKEIDIGRKEIQKREEENKKLKVELEKKEKDKTFFMQLSRDHQKRIEHLETLEETLQVTKKEREDVSEEQVAKYEEKLASHFGMMKDLIGGTLKKPVEIAVCSESEGGSGFSLQSFFDTLYEKKAGDARTVLFNDERIGANRITKLILSEWNIIYDKKEVYDFKYKKDAKAKRKEDTAVDEGGPTRQFLTDVFKQLDILCIKVGEGEVELFENTPGGVQVQTDDPLNHKIQALLKRSSDTHEDTVENAIKRAKDYVRAIGRIILHAIVHKQTLPSNAIPAFFMNVMFHGYDDDYDRHDILKHLNMLDLHAEKLLKVVVDAGAFGLDKHGNKWTPDTFFAEYIPDNFIRSREVLLGSLRDGLSFGGKSEPACDIEKGCGIPTMLSMIPLEAIQRMYFAKPEIQLEDLLGVLLPKYGEGKPNPALGMNDEDVKRLEKAQEIFFKGNFQRYLKESAEEDKYFLVKFVECATGSNYLPFDKNFKINIEFNFSEDPQGYPLFHACTFDVVIPGFEVFFSNYKSFKTDKMNFAIKEVYNQFHMN